MLNNSRLLLITVEISVVQQRLHAKHSAHKEGDSKTRPNGGGDFIFCIKKCLGYRMKIIFNALKTVTLGAHFEPYRMLMEHLQHI